VVNVAALDLHSPSALTNNSLHVVESRAIDQSVHCCINKR
jgi:hypothetical protein